jgi:hypothetical protein
VNNGHHVHGGGATDGTLAVANGNHNHGSGSYAVANGNHSHNLPSV